MSQVDPSSAEPWWRRPGGLGIKDPRSWKTWQLGCAAFLALLVGMAIGYGERGNAPVAEEDAEQIATSEPTTTTVPAQDPPAQTGTPGEGDPVATTTTAAPAAAAPPGAATGPAKVIIEIPATAGPKTTEKFSVAGAEWKVGWAYDCTRTGQGTFEIKPVNGDGSPGSEAPIAQQGPRGKGVTTYTTSGERSLAVNTACAWTLKVTGVSG